MSPAMQLLYLLLTHTTRYTERFDAEGRTNCPAAEWSFVKTSLLLCYFHSMALKCSVLLKLVLNSISIGGKVTYLSEPWR